MSFVFPGNLRSNLVSELEDLQERIAIHSWASMFPAYSTHTVLVSVALSNHQGAVVDTLQPQNQTSYPGILTQLRSPLFARNVNLHSKEQIATAVAQVASYFLGLVNDRTMVVSATARIANDVNSTVLNIVGQAFFDSKNMLVCREVDVQQ